VEVPRVDPARLGAPDAGSGDSSAQVRRRVCAARERQLARAGRTNSALTPKEVERDCTLDDGGLRLMQQAMTRLALSARAYHRILKVARTIADLAGCDAIGLAHLSEAVNYRRLDRGAG
jgi:magnesium chelatase family protein